MQPLLWPFLLLLLLTFSSSWARQPVKCSMGSYDYKGPHHSALYNMTQDAGLKACEARSKLDEASLKQRHVENQQKIDLLIAFMLNEPRCVAVKDILSKYLQLLQKHQHDYQEKVAFDIEWLARYLKHIEIQRQFAIMAAYNTTCAGGHERVTSFLDLDMINQLPNGEAPVTQITQDGQSTQDCAHIEARGSADLKEFTVSLKKALGDSFLFSWDPYSIPDRVIMKDMGGGVLFDSGCTSFKEEHQNMSIPLSALSQSKQVVINVVNNCSVANRNSGHSSWELQLKCQQIDETPCQKEINELIALIREKLGIYREVMDAHANKMQCFLHLDNFILQELIDSELIEIEQGPLKNGICQTMDQECESRKHAERMMERNPASAAAISNTTPIAEEVCPLRPSLNDSIFKHISYAYCTVGRKRLGMGQSIP